MRSNLSLSPIYIKVDLKHKHSLLVKKKLKIKDGQRWLYKACVYLKFILAWDVFFVPAIHRDSYVSGKFYSPRLESVPRVGSFEQLFSKNNQMIRFTGSLFIITWSQACRIQVY